MNLFDILNMLNRHTITRVGLGRWSFVMRNSATWGVAWFTHFIIAKSNFLIELWE